MSDVPINPDHIFVVDYTVSGTITADNGVTLPTLLFKGTTSTGQEGSIVMAFKSEDSLTGVMEAIIDRDSNRYR